MNEQKNLCKHFEIIYFVSRQPSVFGTPIKTSIRENENSRKGNKNLTPYLLKLNGVPVYFSISLFGAGLLDTAVQLE
jgi:hypothetical protein